MSARWETVVATEAYTRKRGAENAVESVEGTFLHMTTLTFVIPKPYWLTSNRHSTNRFHRASQVRALHEIAENTAASNAVAAIAGRVHAAWTVRYPKGVRTDKGEASNAQPTTKALLDGLVTYGVLADDGPQHVVAETFRRGPNLERGSDHEVQLVLTEQEVPW